MQTLVIDTGQNIVGVYSVQAEMYVAYHGRDRLSAVERIRAVDEVVTYNGTELGQAWCDLRELARLAGCPPEQLLMGQHIDMRRICWPGGIWGSGLLETHKRVFGTVPEWGEAEEALSDDEKYVLSNKYDVEMTFRLWEVWKRGELEINGQLR